MIRPTSIRQIALSFTLILFMLTSGCSSLPEKVTKQISKHDFVSARETLLKKDIWRAPVESLEAEQIEAINLFTAGVDRYYSQSGNQFLRQGYTRKADETIREGLSFAPWSAALQQLNSSIKATVATIDKLDAKWSPLYHRDIDLVTAKVFLEEIRREGDIYRDSDDILAFESKASLIVLNTWVQSIESSEQPITQRNLARFENDLKLADSAIYRSNSCISSMVELSLAKSNRETMMEKVIEHTGPIQLCLNRDLSFDQGSDRAKVIVASHRWLRNWTNSNLAGLIENAKPEFDTIDSLETLMQSLPEDMATKISTPICRLHIQAAENRSRSGAASILSLLHIARSRQLCESKPTNATRTMQKRAFASIESGEHLTSSLAIARDPSTDPERFHLARTALIAAIQAKTKAHFSWTFPNPEEKGAQSVLTLEKINFYSPDTQNLTRVDSEYFSHKEKIPNPEKRILRTELFQTEHRRNLAKSRYNYVLSQHKTDPTEESLERVKKHYHKYRNRLHDYNDLRREYYSTPSTITRNVYLPYTYREGDVRYGWSIEIKAAIAESTQKILAESTESGFMRIGTRENDKTPARRNDLELQFEVSQERSTEHLHRMMEKICGDLEPLLTNSVRFKDAAQLSELEIDTAQWLLHPWGSSAATGLSTGVPAWAIESFSEIEIPAFGVNNK